MSETQRDCIHGHLARSCELCEAQNDLAAACELIDRLRAELAALRIENHALKAEREKLLGCRDELREIAEAISDPRIHNTMTIAEWCREASGD